MMMLELLCFSFRSSKIHHKHMASHAAYVAKTYSASMLDKIVIGCFFKHHTIALDPKENTYLVMLCQSSGEPPQSELK